VRIAALGLAFVPLFAALLYRAVVLQVIEGPRLGGLAKDQYQRQVSLPGRRGGIFDRRGAALAASVDVDSIYVDPSELADPKSAARELARALKMDAHRLAASFSGGKHFAWVKR
jgi:cell division protein FtsI (penicillin-binding protein 3)